MMPFLERVTAGRNVPRERLEEVAEHYLHFGGKSPINDHCRALRAAMAQSLLAHGPELPVYWGNRNWHPLLADTLREMRDAGVTRALCLVTSAYASWSGCRQYLSAIEAARAEVGEGAPVIDKIRPFYNHPGFIEAVVARVEEALEKVEPERRADARLAFTAHSIPIAMADGCDYVEQLEDACSLVATELGRSEWQLVFQSRSGPPQVPWLDPDVVEHIEALSMIGVEDLVVVPIGFVSDHMEVVWDLDEEAREKAEELGMNYVRAGTVGTHPRFVEMIRELIVERLEESPRRLALGCRGASPDVCAPGCCEYTRARPAPSEAAES